DVSIPRDLAIGRITPQRVVVTDPVRIVPNIIAGGFIAPRLRDALDALPNTLTERIERPVSDADKLPTDRLWHASSFFPLSPREGLRPAPTQSRQRARVSGFCCVGPDGSPSQPASWAIRRQTPPVVDIHAD